jgi:regulator of sigma E protease
MVVLISAVAFFILITSLILIHEAGHFFAARKAGVVVEEFGFGLPPRAKTLFAWRGTAFTLNWIPFGGFVRLKGENGDTDDAGGNFTDASILARCVILLAGVGMNFLLAFLIFVFGFSVGRWIPTYLTIEEMEQAAASGQIEMELGVYIEEVMVGGGAAKAGIPAKSILIAVDDASIIQPADVVSKQAGKRTVRYTFLTGDAHAERQTVDVEVSPDGKTGVGLRSVPRQLSAPLRDPLTASMLALRETRVVTVQTIVGIAKLFSSLAQTGRVPEGVTGIVGIAQLTYTSVQEGFGVYLRLVALLSLSLAVLNVLPFPALDGGRLLFVLGEAVFRTKDRRFEMITNSIGFGILLLVILLVTFYDVLRLFR